MYACRYVCMYAETETLVVTMPTCVQHQPNKQMNLPANTTFTVSFDVMNPAESQPSPLIYLSARVMPFQPHVDEGRLLRDQTLSQTQIIMKPKTLIKTATITKTTIYSSFFFSADHSIHYIDT